MMLLPFRLPEGFRVQWASDVARTVWEPRLRRLADAWAWAELESVRRGRRPAVLRTTTDLADLLTMAHLPARVVGTCRPPTGYQTCQQAPRPGEPVATRVLLGDLTILYRDPVLDDRTLGRLLGYPDCCIEAFVARWPTWKDLTWPAAQAPVDPTADWPINLFYRWWGVRLIPHLPCSWSCAASRQMGLQMADLIAERDPEARRLLEDLLRFPVVWSELFGIAEVITPLFRLIDSSTATAERLDVRYPGDRFPAEGVRGLLFREAPPAPVVVIPSARLNGFRSLAAMRQAHQHLLALVGSTPVTAAMDLGCGDGTLLRQIPARRRIGVDRAPEALRAAKRQLDHVIEADVTDPMTVRRLLDTEQPDLVLAQADRTPPAWFEGCGRRRVLSYRYEGPSGVTGQLLDISH